MKFLNIIFILILSLNFSVEALSASPNYTKEYKKLVKRFPKAIKNKQGCQKYTQELYAFVARLNSIYPLILMEKKAGKKTIMDLDSG